MDNIITSFISSKKFPGVQPITLSTKTFNKCVDWYLTPKLDGIRRLLIKDNNRYIILSTKLEISNLHLDKICKKGVSVFDAEFFNGKYYVFDVLVMNDIDMRDKKLSERLNSLKNFDFCSNKIIKKRYYITNRNTILKVFENLKKRYSNKKDFDGIIFTPNEIYYTPPLKWKPSKILSIDFKIRKLENNKIALLTSQDKIYVPRITGIPRNISIVKLSDKNWNKYKDGEVVEFVMINKKFYPLRSRPDKIKSNGLVVINSNIETVLNPPNMKELLG